MSFESDVTEWIAKTKGGAQTVIKATILDLSQGIIRGTPVDTGRARANWIPSVGSPDTAVTAEIDKSGDKSLGAVAVEVNYAYGDIFYLTNSLPYIKRLEYDAWSQQAPGGFVRLSVQQFKKNLASHVRNL